MEFIRERESDTPIPELTQSRKIPNKKPPQEAENKMNNLKAKTRTPQFKEGEWNAITAPFLDELEGKDSEYIKGFLEGIAYRFQLNK